MIPFDLPTIIQRIKTQFNIMPYKDDEADVVRQISEGVSFKGSNLWVLIFAIFIASLGLNVNSTAVIIGAMLISPLMGPILGMGLSIGIYDLDLLRRSAKNFGVATLISVLTAMVYFLITPLGEAQSELLARTSPTIYDVLIAFFGGAAGILAQCTKGKGGNVIPGVAIATALMPPLCTAGFGLATGHFLYFLGAFYLFFINTVFIALATYLGVRFMGFAKKSAISTEQKKKAQKIITGLVVVTMIPAVFMTVGIVKRSIFEHNLRNFMKQELTLPGTHIISNEVDKDAKTLKVVAVGKEISMATQKEAEDRMEFYHLGGYKLTVIQGEQSDSILLLYNKLSNVNTNREEDRRQIAELTAKIGAVNAQLHSYTQYENSSVEIKDELKALYPQVQAISLSKVAEAKRDTSATAHFVAAVLTVGSKSITKDDKDKLQQWLKARVKADSLVVYINEK